jgi:hypothetical protein
MMSALKKMVLVLDMAVGMELVKPAIKIVAKMDATPALVATKIIMEITVARLCYIPFVI